MAPPFMFLLFVVGLIVSIVCTVLVIGYVIVPLFRGAGNLITAVFRGIAFLVRHVAQWVGGTIGDLVRMVGAVIAAIVLLPIMLVAVLIGRWSAASHYASSVVAETRIAALCLYRAILRRPLHLLFLDGLVEGLEQRIPVAVENAPATDLPRRGAPAFDGYRIVGSLRAGGSGAKLHVAEPDETLRRRHPEMPAQVVIKSFAISEGSALPQIVRESRALDAARQLGLVLDHGIDANRFFYVMPYHAGDNLGVAARRLHGESGGEGLDGRGLRQASSLVADLLDTLVVYHSGGLWHKDIKPDNIIVHGGRAHVVDLGLVTPLRSAMTLTTHGTEYFRDPEMVRMALRGVKVHQVDGAKFDIYAAGAVLYFILENTFPAHGGLSAFAKRSPEALRWIVRRAMAEYTKRYDRAETMLADLRFVLAAQDQFTVRPAQLPSMRGEVIGAPPPPPAAAGSGRPPVPPAGPWAESLEPMAAKAGAAMARGITAGAAALGIGAASFAGAAAGPHLQVTNWWSGAYEPAIGGGPLPRGLSARQQREAIHERARAAAIAASRIVRRPRDPSRALILLTLLAIGAILGGALILAGLLLPSARIVSVEGVGSAQVTAPGVPSVRGGVSSIEGIRLVGTDGAARTVTLATFKRTPIRVLLVNDHPSPTAPEVVAEIDRVVPKLEARGIEVAVDDGQATADVTLPFLRWTSNAERERDALDRLLATSGYGGVLWVTTRDDDLRNGRTRRPVLELVLSAGIVIEEGPDDVVAVPLDATLGPTLPPTVPPATPPSAPASAPAASPLAPPDGPVPPRSEADADAPTDTDLDGLSMEWARGGTDGRRLMPAMAA